MTFVTTNYCGSALLVRTMEPVGGIAWWAVGGAAIMYYLLGALWFSPLFGRAWDRSLGYDRSTGDGRFPISYYLVPLLGAVLETLVIAVFIALMGTESIAGSVAVGAGVGVCVAAATFTNALTPNTPEPYLFAAVTGGYHLVGCAVVGAMLGATGLV